MNIAATFPIGFSAQSQGPSFLRCKCSVLYLQYSLPLLLDTTSRRLLQEGAPAAELPQLPYFSAGQLKPALRSCLESEMVPAAAAAEPAAAAAAAEILDLHFQ